MPPCGLSPTGETAIFTRRVKALLAQRDTLAPRREFGDPVPFRISSTLGL
jgi:hypothetical protein